MVSYEVRDFDGVDIMKIEDRVKRLERLLLEVADSMAEYDCINPDLYARLYSELKETSKGKHQQKKLTM
ncbi:hypothetical protein [Candidatus Borrarchaeum sp.]|uniref:hypothetical protein n=1 Tax=Candidatus Borrarchaeum sp. TaxID=2846742 RepID=UPI00257995EE|nr:hypothetical protein [Candidatus Borrarchaeum sp.]